jgi:death-on-curing protein
VLLTRLITNHPLPDGNKRSAVVATELFVSLNGAALGASGEEMGELVVWIAAGSVNLAAVTTWMVATITTTIRARPGRPLPARGQH